jgi:hypothetical protein
MAAKRKVDLLELERLLGSGRTMEQIAQRMGVNKGTISKNAKALKFCGAKDVVLRSAARINDQKISAMERLNSLMETVQSELRYTQEAMKDTKGGERREWQDSLIKHAAELRKQLSLLREIMQAAYDIQMVEEFKAVVMEEIGNESPETRQRIFERIKQRRIDRGFPAVG